MQRDVSIGNRHGVSEPNGYDYYNLGSFYRRITNGKQSVLAVYKHVTIPSAANIYCVRHLKRQYILIHLFMVVIHWASILMYL